MKLFGDTPSRKTAGLVTLRESRVNAAEDFGPVAIDARRHYAGRG
jgi:hypothetical protein